MRFVLYTHSLSSDWNHGNAHFQRGILRELVARGHHCRALEPLQGWSLENLLREQGREAVDRLKAEYPELEVIRYDDAFDHEAALAHADVVLVHEWTPPELVERIGALRRRGARFTLLFHDTHHRAVSAQEDIAALHLDDYDGVLAFGETLRERYERAGWGRRVYTWHEAADTSRFHPGLRADDSQSQREDLVWIGNWGDGERGRELREFLIEPVRTLGVRGAVHGVRYPDHALSALREAGLSYRGWLANYDVPRVFAQHRMTVHVPRRPYVDSLPGIPTIRVFEALACGIPLLCAPWHDAEGLFRPGIDYLVAPDGPAMAAQMKRVLLDPALANDLSRSGWETIAARHTCRHRVDELLAILAQLRGELAPPSPMGGIANEAADDTAPLPLPSSATEAFR